MDEHPDVRFRVASTSHMSKALLDRLSGDSHPYVAHRAKSTIKALEDVKHLPAVFDYLAEDHCRLLVDLQGLVDSYSSQLSCEDRLEKTINVLVAVATHFSKQEAWLLSMDQNRLPRGSESLKLLLKQSLENCGKLKERISDLFFVSLEGTDFKNGLEQLLKMVKEHVEFSGNKLFGEVKEHLSPDDMDSLNHRLQHALGATH